MKIIELMDLHIDPKWIEQQKPCLQLQLDTGKNEEIDFFCIAGDIFNRPFYNSDKDCMTFILDHFEKMFKIAPIIMISGTLSHDAPGSYTIFQKMGCHVLQPNKPEIINKVLFIGLPEIDKISLMSRKKMSMDDANYYINDSINKFIKSYWAPIREANKDKPCVFLGHGMFVDDINKQNPIIQNTDVVIDNKKLKEIKADRYIFGHIHQPSESKMLNGVYGGFMGFDRTPWNNTGFQPGFNLTEIMKNQYSFKEDDLNECFNYNFIIKTTRIDYPVIQKEKIKMKADDILNVSGFKLYKKFMNSDVRINLEISKKDLLKIDIIKLQEFIKKDNNLNSCIIVPDIIREESSRITQDQLEKIKTLWDKYALFKGWENLENHKSIELKINKIAKNVSLNTTSQEKKVIKLLSLTVHGSIFSIDAQNKNTFHYDFSNDPTGLTLISGDNGKGKSTFFGFASPYPIFIGWDYRSLHDFFILDDSVIEKNFSVNGIRHQHLIYIRKKKIECFWNVEDKPFLKAVSLSDFTNECIKFFGPIESFISTCFFSQEPHRMKKYTSSLVASSPIELRNAYMSIVGIDRTEEKKYAKEKKDELLKIISALEIKKNTMNSFMADNQTIEDEKNRIIKRLNELDTELGKIVYNEFEKSKQFDKIAIEYNKQVEIKLKLNHKESSWYTMQNKKNNTEDKIHSFKKIDIKELKKQLEKNEIFREEMEELRKLWQALNKDKMDIYEDIKNNEIAVRDCETKLSKIDNSIFMCESNIREQKEINKLLKTPCEFCGKISSKSNKEIEDNKKRILTNEQNIIELRFKEGDFNKLLKEHQEYIAAELEKIPTQKMKDVEEESNRIKLLLLSLTEKIEITSKIDDYKTLEVLKESKKTFELELNVLSTEIEKLKNQLNPFCTINHDNTKKELHEIQTQLNEKNNELSKQNGLLESIQKQLTKIEEYKEELKQVLKTLDENVINMNEWEIIEKDMMPHKLPGFELDIISSEIDFEINQKLKNRYIFKTDTQYVNDKGDIIDQFKINIYNPVSGIEKALLAHSPGQRAAYFIEPISQALRKKRQEREGIIFTWSVSDETDNPIKYTRVRDYYEIMEKSLQQGHVRFIMSQKSEIYSFIKNTIDIEKIGVDTP